MSQNFYNKVAKKFGGYTTPADKPVREYLGEDPEKIFKEKLIEISGKDKVVLDIGCADGRFTLSISPYFQKIYAIDFSKEMLKVASRSKYEMSNCSSPAGAKIIKNAKVRAQKCWRD